MSTTDKQIADALTNIAEALNPRGEPGPLDAIAMAMGFKDYWGYKQELTPPPGVGLVEVSDSLRYLAKGFIEIFGYDPHAKGSREPVFNQIADHIHGVAVGLDHEEIAKAIRYAGDEIAKAIRSTTEDSE